MSAIPAKSYPALAAFERIKAAADALGLTVAGFRVEPGGAISVWDKTCAPLAPPEPANEIEKWREKKRKG